MSLLTAHRLAMSYGPLDVFEGVDLAVANGDRIGLVGPNGEGKTTLLRILAGQLQPTAGAVHRRRGLRIGYLPQDPPPPGDKTLWDDLLEVFAGLRAEEAALRDLEAQMADPDHGEAALALYAERQHRFELAGGYDYPLRIQQTLTGLGFRPDQFDLPLNFLSGGQRTRGLLARLLLEKPDLLLLDEPTNHLDLNAVEWLEDALLGWEGAMILVAHDRYFLDRVATKTWEMAWGELTAYRGNYSHYVIQREDRLERLRKDYEAQQEFIAKEEDYIRRNLAGQNTRQAQGRRTRLERLLAADRLAAPRHRHRLNLAFQNRLRSGTLVLATSGLVAGYHARPTPVSSMDRSGGIAYTGNGPIQPEDTVLFSAEDVLLKRGERVGVIGPNGAGKTTFVRTLLGQIPPLAGELRLGASLRPGYLAQVQAALKPEWTALDALTDADPRLLPAEARHILARYLFTDDDVFKTVDTLSGGQRSRLALARLSRQQANFLVLDEPTNHLDIESQEVLEAMLAEFNGTVLLVSHDRYLIDAIATQVWAIQGGRMRAYEGNYSSYLAARAAEAAQQSSAEVARTESQQQRERSREERRKRREDEKRQAEAAAVESEIETLENQLAEIGEALARASHAQRLGEVQALGERYVDVEQQLHQLLESWAEMA
ncbi:MAG: ABC-F family ATP-binding cassette domain-containing protein [Caldilineales bacterium]|nr:ABC-F family ATP-binding cassette domain-containing protein [Caldilineales bacterium]MCW5860005.1 ABC-F family ATP-binding cassette domain-containing protein [Caldilineales bacterium]